jgi:hypothetical protein
MFKLIIAVITGLWLSGAAHAIPAGTSVPSKVRVEHVFEQPVEAVWQKLGRFCGITQWQSLVASCLVEERQDGFYRVVVMKNDSAYIERLDHFSHLDKSFQYSILSGPLPVTGYVSRLQIVPVDASHSRLIWQAWYDQPSSNPEVVARDLEALFLNGLSGMKSLMAEGQ